MPTQAKIDWPRAALKERQAILKSATHNRAVAAALVQLVRAPRDYGVYASLGPNYHYSIFGRDSIEFAEDTLEYFPDLAREIIGVAARLQGRQIDPIREEEPGKIHHEYRLLQFDGDTISAGARAVYYQLLSHWGHKGDDYVLYYGSVDATGLFIRLVGLFVQRYGEAVLEDEVKHHSGTVVTVRQAVSLATDWLANKLVASPWGLLEFKRSNLQGLPNQGWKDSETAYLHRDGSRANADGGIASVEVQGFAFDALLMACKLLHYPASREQQIVRLATQLAHKTIESMWLPEEQFFAMGLDRDKAGNARQIATLTSNAGLLLQSGLLGVLERAEALNYIRPIVKKTMDETHFLTAAGVRCRSLQHVDLIHFADYHGSLVTWPKDTANIAEGFRKWGFWREADELDKRFTKSIVKAGEAYEFFYVDRANRAKLHYRIEHNDEPTFHTFGAANLPEPMQAWSLACFLKVVLR